MNNHAFHQPGGFQYASSEHISISRPRSDTFEVQSGLWAVETFKRYKVKLEFLFWRCAGSVCCALSTQQWLVRKSLLPYSPDQTPYTLGSTSMALQMILFQPKSKRTQKSACCAANPRGWHMALFCVFTPRRAALLEIQETLRPPFELR